VLSVNQLSHAVQNAEQEHPCNLCKNIAAIWYDQFIVIDQVQITEWTYKFRAINS